MARARSSAAAATRWAADEYQKANPQARLPAAVRSAYQRARDSPGSAMLAGAAGLVVTVVVLVVAVRDQGLTPQP